MKKITYIIEMPYTYEAERSGSKYCIGGKYKNHGEFVESVMKHRRGLDYMVNPATSFDKGSDIESEHMSVKSDRASLARLYGATKEEVLSKFFAQCASQFFAWGYDKDGEMTEYIMDKVEFYDFCMEFGAIGVESSAKANEKGYKVRFNTTSKTMLKWFDARLAAA